VICGEVRGREGRWEDGGEGHLEDGSLACHREELSIEKGEEPNREGEGEGEESLEVKELLLEEAPMVVEGWPDLRRDGWGSEGGRPKEQRTKLELPLRGQWMRETERAAEAAKTAAKKVAKTKQQKSRRFPSPMQLLTKAQWWSSSGLMQASPAWAVGRRAGQGERRDASDAPNSELRPAACRAHTRNRWPAVDWRADRGLPLALLR
jgi:hypothetical protein